MRATLEGWNALTKKEKKHPSHIIVDVREDLYKIQLLIKKTMHFCARTKSRNRVSQSSTTEYWAILVLHCAIELYIEWWSTTQEM